MKQGTSHIEKSKHKMSLSHMGHSGYWKGKHRSEETKQKISESNKGHKLSKDTKEKIRNSLLGCRRSIETREKIRRANLGDKNPNYGKSRTQETKRKISIATIGSKNPFHGKRHSKEFKEKQCIRGVQRLANHEIPFMDTSIELKIKEQLENANIDFIQQYNINNKFCCDFYIPWVNLIIEADGDYWHSRELNIKRDKAKDVYLEKRGYNLIRIPEHVINMNSFEITDIIGWC